MIRRLLQPIWIIPLVVLLLAITNYQHGTYLTGWDNLHPEFDFLGNIKRSFFAVWQEYQGLGLLGGMAHSSDLLRQVFLLLLSAFVPVWGLRYVWTLLMLLAGGVGAYKLTELVLGKKHANASWVSTIAGLFYILNLATIQVFWVPFESFTAHFASLPWLVWGTINYFSRPSIRTLGLFALVSLLSTPSYYVPTFFVVTLLVWGLVCLIYLVASRRVLVFFDILKLFGVLLLTNVFWLLPFLYFTLTNSHVAFENKINQMGTGTIFLENQKYGGIQDVALLRGFWFDKVDPDLGGNLKPLMLPWQEYLGNPPVLALGYIFFVVILVGVFISLRKRGINLAIVCSLFLLSLTMLLSATPPFSWLGNFFREQVPLFNQIFRFPFTKFSTLASLTYAVLFAVGVGYFINKIRYLNKLGWRIYFVPIALLLLFVLPAFRGNLFYSKEQIKIPQEYFDVFNFFKKEGQNTRIANFPQYTFWGWNYYRWGYGGSGFLWYGIDQPILDRAFDPWSRQNENYYWEISQALYSRNSDSFSGVLDKYQINWLVLDENVVNYSSPKSLYFDELNALLTQSGKANLSATFGSIKIYKVNLAQPVNNFVFVAGNLPSVAPTYNWDNNDVAYLDHRDYMSDTTPDYYYPFRSLFTGKQLQDKEFVVEDAGDSFVFKADVPEKFFGYTLNAPNTQGELVYIDPDKLEKVTQNEPQVFFENGEIKVIFPKTPGYFSRELDPTDTTASRICDTPDESLGKQVVLEKRVLQSYSKDISCRVSFWVSSLGHDLSYIISVQSRNIKGQPYVFWLENSLGHKADIETFLPRNIDFRTDYIVQPPMAFDGVGYTIHFDNRSPGNSESINELGQIRVYPIPYKFLKNLALFAQDKPVQVVSYLDNVVVEHPNQAAYRVSLTPEDNSTLVLSQAYDKGWTAYRADRRVPTFLVPFFGKKIVDHVLVNNWQNGWKIGEEDREIAIVYLPQYLEFIGFGFLALGVVWFMLSSKLWNLRLSYFRREKKQKTRKH